MSGARLVSGADPAYRPTGSGPQLSANDCVGTRRGSPLDEPLPVHRYTPALPDAQAITIGRHPWSKAGNTGGRIQL